MSPKSIVPVCGTLIAVLSLLPVAGMAAPAAPSVAVVDFYAPTPVGEYGAMVPERFAADDLSDLLGRAAGGRFMLIPREAVERAEADLRWHTDDVLHFARLSALAQAVHADRLVVGWISVWAVGHGGGSIDIVPGGGGGPITGAAMIVMQVFDAAQGRIVAETRAEGNSQGGISALVAQETLHDADERVLPFLLTMLTAPGL